MSTGRRHSPVHVFAYSGASGEEEPRAIDVGGRRLAVLRISSRWREPEGRFFRVLCEDGEVRLLLCREPDLSWWLVTDATDPAEGGDARSGA